MSGHSKWSTIKHKKGAVDAKRGKIFTKIIKEISVAAKMGGGAVDSNPRLRSAVGWAKSENMPADNIGRAIKKGTGEMDQVTYDEIVYEGYGPNGVAAIIECLTDNKNRTVASIRTVFNKCGCTMGNPNSVMHTFDRKGVIRVKKSLTDSDTLMEIAIDSGSDDIETDDPDYYIVYTDPTALHTIEDCFKQKNIPTENAKIERIPKNNAVISNKDDAVAVMRFIDMLEENDDVQNVYTNFDISEDIAAEL